MAEIIRMPEVLTGATEATIQKWLVEEGTEITVDQPIAEIETDKAIVELTAETAGSVGRLLVSEGVSVLVGVPILVLLAVGEDEKEVGPALASAEESSLPMQTSKSETPTKASSMSEQEESKIKQAETDQRRLFASPLVRRLAAEAGVNLAAVPGRGPNGRISRRDLEQYLAQRESAPWIADTSAPAVSTGDAVVVSSDESSDFEDIPIDRMRRAIANRLTESNSTVPHFYLTVDCRVEALLELRRVVNERASRKISVTDFVVKSVACAFDEVPEANAIWNGDSIRRFKSVDISVAVATEGGLVTPVLRKVERQSIKELSAMIADLAGRAREGRIKQHELEGGNFSVSNLGVYGTRQFSAILNPPQSGILAVGAIRAAPVIDAEGELTVGQVMTVTLSADHRVLDGAVAAKWLNAFTWRVENPLTILV